MANENTATIPTSDSNLLLECETDLKDKSSSSSDSVTTKVMFADKERARRSRDNKLHQQNLKKRKAETATIAQRNKEKKNTPQISFPYEELLSTEIQRILKFDVNQRIKESVQKFRWVMPCSCEDRYILQFQVSDGLFIDLLYVAKSNILNAGYGLSAARELPKGLEFSVYLGRLVKHPKKIRKYVIELSKKFVHKRDGNDKWETIRSGQSRQFVDGLMNNSITTWKYGMDMFLGAHILNDPKYKDPQENKQTVDENVQTIEPNCSVQPLLEVVTTREIKVDEELLISYNFGSK